MESPDEMDSSGSRELLPSHLRGDAARRRPLQFKQALPLPFRPRSSVALRASPRSGFSVVPPPLSTLACRLPLASRMVVGGTSTSQESGKKRCLCIGDPGPRCLVQHLEMASAPVLSSMAIPTNVTEMPTVVSQVASPCTGGNGFKSRSSVPLYRFEDMRIGLDAAVEEMQYALRYLKQLFEDGWVTEISVPCEHVYEFLWRARQLSLSLDEACYRGLMLMEDPNPPDIEDWWDDEDKHDDTYFDEAKWAEDNNVDLEELYDRRI